MFRKHFKNQLSAYLHGELDSEASGRVEEHLAGCRRCREEYKEIRFGAQLAAQLSRDQAPADLWFEVERAMNREAAHRRGAESAEVSQKGWSFGWPPLKVAVAAVPLVLLIAFIAWWIYPGQPGPAWEVTRIEGQPRIGQASIGDAGKLKVGEWLTTDDASRAEIRVGEIGQVQVEPSSRIRLVEARADEHRLALARGRMQAFIWAPPRQFFVDTPSAVAVDLGCAYTLEVDENGQGLLNVIAGWVAFEWQGRESFVPAMAMCITRPQLGPGTPWFNDASEEFQNALAIFDVSQVGSDARLNALQTVLTKARKRDALTLWHLLAGAEGEDRLSVYNRLAELIPPPPQITSEAVMRGDRGALDLWWEKLELGSAEWWRIWKGPVPSQTK
jgi:predicted anti-sigma-YlaC factor YlaD